MKAFRLTQCLASIVLLLGVFTSAAMPSDVIYLDSRIFEIPVNVLAEQKHKIKEIQLFSSSDLGHTWKQTSTIGPEKDTFVFTAPEDGMYWFSVRVQLKDGTFEPREVTETSRSVKVQVGGEKPVPGSEKDSVQDLKTRIEKLQLELKQLQKQLLKIEKATSKPQ